MTSELGNEVPDSLRHEDLVVVWQAARKQLERFGSTRRGSVTLPMLSDAAALRLTSLLGTNLTARLDLDRLEQALNRQGVADDLDQALTLLGAPASRQRKADRADVARRQAARQSIEDQVDQWPEHWRQTWANWLFQSGQMVNENAETAGVLARMVRQLLDRWALLAGEPMARNDLAVSLCGSAHALDDGVLLERCARRALWHALKQPPDYHDGRSVWIAAGILTDRVSAPVLTWRLPLDRFSELGGICSAADAARVPIHLTPMALAHHDIRFHTQEPVLLVENPRVVEAAAERQVQRCVIATNGNPSTAVMQLVEALLAAAIEVRHHGDFDAAGVGICRRLAERGCSPWRMGAQDYDDAVNKAMQLGLALPVEASTCGPTPWDPLLQLQMNLLKWVVHEELLLDDLLGESEW